MNEMTKPPGLPLNMLSTYDSKFEKLDGNAVLEKSIPAQLGVKLRRVFSLPGPETMPDAVRTLLEKIESEFDPNQ